MRVIILCVGWAAASFRVDAEFRWRVRFFVCFILPLYFLKRYCCLVRRACPVMNFLFFLLLLLNFDPGRLSACAVLSCLVLFFSICFVSTAVVCIFAATRAPTAPNNSIVGSPWNNAIGWSPWRPFWRPRSGGGARFGAPSFH